MIHPDAELTASVNDLLRTEPRLLAAAPLVGKVAALYRDPKPEAAPPKAGKMSPPRVDADGTTTVTFTAADLQTLKVAVESSGEVTGKPPGPAAIPSPWHGVVVVAKADGLAKFPLDFWPEVPEDLRREESGVLTRDAALAEMNGGPILAKVTIDGTLWERLDGAGQRAALVAALRGLRHKTRASDDADLAVIEKPPIRTWPDTVDEAAEVMVQLGPDGAEGAALIGALALGGLGDALGEAVAAFKRRLDAGQDMRSWYSDLADLQSELDAVVVRVARQCDTPARDMDAAHPPIRSAA